jgi:hypothetical protein
LIGEWRLHEDEEPAIQGDQPQTFCTKNEIKNLGARILTKMLSKQEHATVEDIDEMQSSDEWSSKLFYDRLCIKSYCIRKHAIGLRFDDTTGHGIQKGKLL